MRETEYTIHADQHNWKYAWFGEHHALTEYSHMSAPEVVHGLLARTRPSASTSASGIVSLPPVKDHPVRVAERAAMLDHLTDGRYEFGTGRGAGSHEVASFDIMDTNETKAMWDEVIREIPRMWEQHDYTFEGDHFTRADSAQHPARSRTARGTRRSGWRAATRPRSPRPARSASARSRSTSSRSTT